MFKPFVKLDEGASLAELLALEELKGEKIRGRVLLYIFMALFVGALFVKFAVLPATTVAEKLLGGKFPINEFVILFGVMFLYELFFFLFLSYLVKRRTTVFDGPRYGNIVFETGFVTSLLWILASSLSPSLALNSPVVMIYFPFILLSILRMKFLFSLITGILSAGALTLLGFHYFPLGSGTGFFDSISPVVSKSVVVLIAGAIAGYVASELRKRIESALRISGERERVVAMFGQYISSSVVDKLLAQKSEFEGEIRHVALMFFDIRNFTRFSSIHPPQEVVEFLNRLFSDLIPIVNAHNGIVNKFLGDGFMAVFGAPLSDGRDAENAVEAGLEICSAVERMNREKLIPETRVGIGVHCGEAVTGTVGSRERKEYTIIGDTVNLASRIEQLNKEFGSTFLVSDAVFAAVSNIADTAVGEPVGRALAAEKMTPVVVKGKEGKVQTYRLV